MLRGKIKNKTQDRFYRYWLPVIAWAAMIFYLSSFPSFPKAVQPLFSFDKIAHALEYAILGFLLARAFGSSEKERYNKYFRVLAVICAMLYGMSDELHQYFVPLRTSSIFDVMSDTLGAILGQYFFKKQGT